MTLGGLALAVGILVDDATVTIEKHRNATSKRATQSAKPFSMAPPRSPFPLSSPRSASVSSFMPMFSSQRRSSLPSSFPSPKPLSSPCSPPTSLSRTLVPHSRDVPLEGTRTTPAKSSSNPFRQVFSVVFERAFHESPRLLPIFCSSASSNTAASSIPAFPSSRVLAVFPSSSPWLGQDFFPSTDSGQFILHLRARPEPASRKPRNSAMRVENRHPPRNFPKRELDSIGRQHRLCLTAPSTTCTAPPASIGARRCRHPRLPQRKIIIPPPPTCASSARQFAPRNFPAPLFIFFLPTLPPPRSLISGLPAPVDIQIEGSDTEGNRRVADKILAELRQVPGIARPAHAAAFRLPAIRSRHRPHQSPRKAGFLSERDVRQQHAHLAQRQASRSPPCFS